MPHSPEALRERLRSMAEPDYAAFSSELIPDLKRGMMGIRIPILRKLAKELAKENAARVLDERLGDAWHEEVLLRGLVIGYARFSWDEWTERVRAFVPLIDNWAVCDIVVSSLTLVRKHRTEGWKFLRPYWLSNAEYEQRFALIMLKSHYLTDEYADRVLEVIAGLKPNGYYAAMAAGWTLQTAFAQWPDRVFHLITDPRIDGESRRLARKKILESLRTPPEWRERVKKLHL